MPVSPAAVMRSVAEAVPLPVLDSYRPVRTYLSRKGIAMNGIDEAIIRRYVQHQELKERQAEQQGLNL